jgi:hypothetical protein
VVLQNLKQRIDEGRQGRVASDDNEQTQPYQNDYNRKKPVFFPDFYELPKLRYDSRFAHFRLLSNCVNVRSLGKDYKENLRQSLFQQAWIYAVYEFDERLNHTFRFGRPTQYLADHAAILC